MMKNSGCKYISTTESAKPCGYLRCLPSDLDMCTVNLLSIGLSSFANITLDLERPATRVNISASRFCTGYIGKAGNTPANSANIPAPTATARTRSGTYSATATAASTPKFPPSAALRLPLWPAAQPALWPIWIPTRSWLSWNALRCPTTLGLSSARTSLPTAATSTIL